MYVGNRSLFLGLFKTYAVNYWRHVSVTLRHWHFAVDTIAVVLSATPEQPSKSFRILRVRFEFRALQFQCKQRRSKCTAPAATVILSESVLNGPGQRWLICIHNWCRVSGLVSLSYLAKWCEANCWLDKMFDAEDDITFSHNNDWKRDSRESRHCSLENVVWFETAEFIHDNVTFTCVSVTFWATPWRSWLTIHKQRALSIIRVDTWQAFPYSCVMIFNVSSSVDPSKRWPSFSDHCEKLLIDPPSHGYTSRVWKFWFRPYVVYNCVETFLFSLCYTVKVQMNV